MGLKRFFTLGRVNQPLRRVALRNLPLATKISVLLVILLLISGIATERIIHTLVRNSQQARSEAELVSSSRLEAVRFVNLLSEELNRVNNFTTLDFVQESLIESGELSSEVVFNDTVEVNAELETFRIAQGQTTIAVLVNANENIIGVSPAISDIEQVDREAWNWYHGAMRGEVYIGGGFEEGDGLGNIDGIRVAVPVFGTESLDEPIGVFYVVLDESQFIVPAKPLIMQQGDGNSEGSLEQDIAIYDTSGNIIVESISGSNILPAAVRNAIQEDPAGAVRLASSTNNELREYGFTRLDSLGTGSIFGDLGWVVVARQPETYTSANVSLNTTPIQVILLIASIAVIVLSLLIIYLFTRPLYDLADVTRHIIAQNNLKMSLPDYPDEGVQQISESFKTLMDRLQYRVSQLEAAAQVSQEASLTKEISVALERVAQMLYRRFDYSGVRLYLLDSTEKRARIVAARGIESDFLMSTGYAVLVDNNTLTGRSMMLREYQIYQGVEPRFAGSYVEPAELAVPLMIGGRVLGAMHVLGNRPSAFDQQDIDIMLLVSNQLGSLIENARLLDQSASSLAQIEALNRRLTREGWQEYLGDQGALRHTLDPGNNWPDAIENIYSRVRIEAETYTDADGREVVAVPLILRGQVVGTIAATRPPEGQWTSEEISVLESIASRMTVIAESIRLVDEASQRAAREELVNEVSSEIMQRAASVDSVLQTALSQLGGALGSDRVSLRIGKPQDLPSRAKEPQEDKPDGSSKSISPSSANGDGG